MFAPRTSLVAALLAFPALLPAQESAPPPQAFDIHGDPLPAFARARLGNTRFRHGDPIGLVRFLPDGQLLTIGRALHQPALTARVWDSTTGKESYQFTLSRDKEPDWALAPDGRTWRPRSGAQRSAFGTLPPAGCSAS